MKLYNGVAEHVKLSSLFFFSSFWQLVCAKVQYKN